MLQMIDLCLQGHLKSTRGACGFTASGFDY